MKRLVDLDTGEIIEGVSRVITTSQEKKIESYKQLQNQRKNLREVIKKNCGDFYFYRYDKLLERLKDDSATAFRFLYLCACADKDGYLIKYGKEYCKTKDDFTYIFDRPVRTARTYTTTLIANELLYKDSNGYRLNPMFYSMGGMDDDFKRQSVRTFNQAIKDLYYNSDPKEHTFIGQLLKLVPYINIYRNVLCTDINCAEKDKLKPLTKTEIVSILQPDNNYGYQLFDKLMNTFIKGEPVIGLFRSMGIDQYVINPKVFYRGNNYKELQDLIDMFDISKYQYLKKQENKKKMRKAEEV